EGCNVRVNGRLPSEEPYDRRKLRTVPGSLAGCGDGMKATAAQLSSGGQDISGHAQGRGPAGRPGGPRRGPGLLAQAAAAGPAADQPTARERAAVPAARAWRPVLRRYLVGRL